MIARVTGEATFFVVGVPSRAVFFTVGSASACRQVPIVLDQQAIFQRKMLRNASFSRVEQLVEATEKFTAATTRTPLPLFGENGRSRVLCCVILLLIYPIDAVANAAARTDAQGLFPRHAHENCEKTSMSMRRMLAGRSYGTVSSVI